MHHTIRGLREAEGVAPQHLAALRAQLQGSKVPWSEPARFAACLSCQKTFIMQRRLRLLLSIQRLAGSTWENGAIPLGSGHWRAYKQARGTDSCWALQSSRLRSILGAVSCFQTCCQWCAGPSYL